MPEAIVIRKSLEETSARLAAHRASGSRVLALRAILERQREADLAGDRNVFHLADEAFHAAIADPAGYPGIWKLVLQVKAHVDRYRRLTLPQEGRMTRALGEHEIGPAMIEAGDSTGAAAAMAAHLDGLLTDIPDIRRLNPDYFAEAKPAPRSDRPHQCALSGGSRMEAKSGIAVRTLLKCAAAASLLD